MKNEISNHSSVIERKVNSSYLFIIKYIQQAACIKFWYSPYKDPPVSLIANIQISTQHSNTLNILILIDLKAIEPWTILLTWENSLNQ